MSDASSWFPELRPADEPTALEQFLDHYRHIVTCKLADLDQAQASARTLDATDLTVGGIVKHLAWAEDRWFQGKLLGLELPEPWASTPLAEDPDWPFPRLCAESRCCGPVRLPRRRRRDPPVREGPGRPLALSH